MFQRNRLYNQPVSPSQCDTTILDFVLCNYYYPYYFYLEIPNAVGSVQGTDFFLYNKNEHANVEDCIEYLYSSGFLNQYFIDHCNYDDVCIFSIDIPTIKEYNLKPYIETEHEMGQNNG